MLFGFCMILRRYFMGWIGDGLVMCFLIVMIMYMLEFYVLEFYRRVCVVVDKIMFDVEIIFVDDGLLDVVF